MVTAESLCCGTPVVGFKAGAPEMITIDKYSSFVDQGDLDALERELRGWLQGMRPRQLAVDACEKYAKEIMCQHYSKVYHDILSR